MLEKICARYYPPDLVLKISECGKDIEKHIKLPKMTELTDISILTSKIIHDNSCFLPYHEQKLKATLKKIRNMHLIDYTSFKLEKSVTPHVMPLVYACFNKGGEVVLTTSYDRSAKIFETSSGYLLNTLTGHSNTVKHCCFNLPVGNLISTASFDRTARIWDAATGKCLSILAGHTQEVIYVNFSYDTTYLVTASIDCTARLWDVERGALIRQLDEHTGPLVSVNFSPDTLNFYEEQKQSNLTISNLLDEDLDQTEEPNHLENDDGENDEITPNSSILEEKTSQSNDKQNLLLTAACDQTARLWDTRSPDSICVLRGHRDDVTAAIFSGDSMTIATASNDSTARLWDIRQNIAKKVLKGHEGPILNMALSSDGEMILTASADKTAKVWRSDGSIVFSAQHDSEVHQISLSPQEHTMLTGCEDGTVQLWNIETQQCQEILRDHKDDIIKAQFNYDANMILTASKDNSFKIWKSSSKKERKVQLINSH